MDPISLYNSDIFKWVILPLLIFASRLLDVSLGTIRIIFISRGIKYIAPIIGFIEINIWLLAIGQIVQNLNNIACSIAYAGGFATGNLLGMIIEEKLSVGMALLKIITRHKDKEIIEYLKNEKYGITIHNADGLNGPVKIIETVIKRQDLKKIIKKLEEIHPHIFYIVEDVRSVGEAIVPRKRYPYIGFIHSLRKSK
ncbi:MAG: DUF2179 domain-containing protein [Candidatus Thermoplasmatota archaeon]